MEAQPLTAAALVRELAIRDNSTATDFETRGLDPSEWVSVTFQDAPGLTVDWQSIFSLRIQPGVDSVYPGFRTVTKVARSMLQRERYCCSRLKL